MFSFSFLALWPVVKCKCGRGHLRATSGIVVSTPPSCLCPRMTLPYHLLFCPHYPYKRMPKPKASHQIIYSSPMNTTTTIPSITSSTDSDLFASFLDLTDDLPIETQHVCASSVLTSPPSWMVGVGSNAAPIPSEKVAAYLLTQLKTTYAGISVDPEPSGDVEEDVDFASELEKTIDPRVINSYNFCPSTENSETGIDSDTDDCHTSNSSSSRTDVSEQAKTDVLTTLNDENASLPHKFDHCASVSPRTPSTVTHAQSVSRFTTTTPSPHPKLVSHLTYSSGSRSRTPMVGTHTTFFLSLAREAMA